MTSALWTLASEEPDEVPPFDVDGTLYRWTVERADEQRSVLVVLSGTLTACDPAGLDFPIAANVLQKGRPAVLEALARGRTPERITITTAGIIEGASPVQYLPTHVQPVGPPGPNTTAYDYRVDVDGEYHGTVRLLNAAGRGDSAKGVTAWIAERLNQCQASIGPQRTREALGAVLEL